ncbi:MAG: RagB/SusD family nutrient uptake outer membrane protein [Prevotella sp.]|nr:RagB/SusD family nutrient uptake outer membrane protein [Prevotellaceae bacterium]MDD6671325.1 RagB/SusD family nutrient uptake outer membrane protein [Prevotella sp.]
MKINKILYAAMAGAVLTFASCEDFTDVQPKGKNLLSTTDQLEMLLNHEYEGGNSDMRIMAGDMVYALSPLINEISKPTKSRNVIMWTYDEANLEKMAELTASDNDYTYYYGIIGKISNPILKQVEAATGDDAKKKSLKSEALTLRAWAYYMLVNKFAKAYNPASAANDPGIIIMTEETDIQTPQPKSTVQEVYDRIIADCDLAIETNGLAPMAVNKMRMNKACPYAVKAQALLSMQRWDEAEAAAKEALAINGVVNDYNTNYKGTMTGYMLGGTYEIIDRGQKGTDEDYFLNPYLENFDSYTPESWAYLENGHAYNKIGNANLMYDNLMDFAQMYIGEAGWLMTFDLNSYWNDGGLRSPQMYLVVAECEFHKGNIDAAMEALDNIRVGRISPDVYQPLKSNVITADDAKEHIKQVTCNEYLFSVDIFIAKKRWNQVSGWEASYSRTIAGQTYTIKPDSKMWIFPFPQSVLNNNPNITKHNYEE